MKKAFAVILLLALVLAGRANRNQAAPPGTEAFQINSHPTFSTEVTEVTERLDDKMAEDKLTPTETEATSGKDNSNEMTDTVEKSTDPSKSEPDPTKPQDNDEQSQTKPPQEVETIPTIPPATEPGPSTQVETVPTNPETEPTESVTIPTVPTTEPKGCTHEWQCTHHSEEGHWKAGIMCDCGWTVYGDPSKLNSLWNTHSASFPPAESLFDHGGFGSVDEWIVDKPAYDEWVCRHCGEPKE